MRDDSTLTAEPPVVPLGPRLAPVPTRPLWTLRRAVVLIGAYLAGLLAMVLTRGLHISSDRYFLILLVPAVALGLSRRYLIDFGVFIAAMIGYEYSRGLAFWLNDTVLDRGAFYAPMIDAEKALFGGAIPTQTLQSWFWNGHVRWFDHLVAYFDHVHFFVPPTLLFLIWLERRALFYRCALALVTTSLIGALVFLAFPAAPPWLAAQHGLIDVVNINAAESAVNGLPHGASLIAGHIPRNAVAAVPSLHAAYALLTLLFAWSWRRRVGHAFLVYPVAMWFTIVYLGDHYVVDVLAGVLVALVGWTLSGRLLRPGGSLRRLAGPFPPPFRHARLFGGPPL